MRVAALVAAALLVGAAPADATPAPKKSTAAAKRAAAKKRLCLKRARTASARRKCVVPVKRKPVVAPKPPLIVPTPAPVVTPAPVESPAAPVVTETPAAPPVVAPPACDPSPWIKATAEDVNGFRLRLSRDCVPAGTVLFSFVNTDAQPHNLFVEGLSPAAPAKKVIDDSEGSTTGSAELAAGTWRVYCAIAGHEAMTKTISAR